MENSGKAFLIIADISGFTHFMSQPTISLCHAKLIVVRLLKAIIGQTEGSSLEVAEIEGDAVFFYVFAGSNEVATGASVVEKVDEVFRAFERERDLISDLRTCHCAGCLQAAKLELKQVIHCGEVVVEKIDRFEKLFGPDVILVHRMLKNSVKQGAYVMMTRPVYEILGGYRGLPAECHRDELEGMGEVETVVFYPEGPSEAYPEGPSEARISMDNETVKPTLRDKLAWRVEMSWRQILDVLRIRPVEGDFRNIPS